MLPLFSNKKTAFKRQDKHTYHFYFDSVSPIKPNNQSKFGAFLVHADNKLFKMRICQNKKKAKRIEEMIYIMPECLPYYYGRSGRKLLFDFVAGDFIDKIELSNSLSFKVGAMMGKANSLQNYKANKKFNAYIYNKVNRLNRHKIYSHSEIAKILDEYKQLDNFLGVSLVPEMRDMHCRNLIVTKDNSIYFIDEQGFRISVKGLGLVKVLLTEKMIHGESNLDSFWEGYRQFCPSDYFTPEYQMLLRSIEMLISLKGMAIRNPVIKKEKDYFLDFLTTIKS